MSKKISFVYIIVTILFLLFTFYEIKIYLDINSNLLGLIYLFINFFISFVLFTLTYNYKKGDVKIRISKNIVVVLLGVFSSFILTFVVPILLSYSDESFVFNDNVFIVSKVLKPILYATVLGLSILEIKNIKKR